MVDDFILSKKIFDNENFERGDIRFRGNIKEKDVKEFIKRLKEDVEFSIEHRKIINKLAGSELIK